MNRSRPIATFLLVACARLTPAFAQAPIPDVHFGANAFPAARSEVRLTLSANRFTEFDGTGDPTAGLDQPGRFPSTVDYTTGFQLATLSATDRLTSCDDLTYTLSVGAGFSADQPTRFLQNDFLHLLKDIPDVPVGETRESVEALGGASLTWWSEPVARVPESPSDGAARFGWFAGAGLAASTLYQEAEAHVGAQLQSPRIDLGFTEGSLRLGLLGRGSANLAGDAFEDVRPFSMISQVELSWVPDRARLQPWYLLGGPSLGLTITHDSGLFEDYRDGGAIDSWFLSVRAEWPNGLRFETWNDKLNGTDFGPSFGFLVGIDVTSFFRGGSR